MKANGGNGDGDRKCYCHFQETDIVVILNGH